MYKVHRIMSRTYKILYANIIIRITVYHRTIIRSNKGNLGEIFSKLVK